MRIEVFREERFFNEIPNSTKSSNKYVFQYYCKLKMARKA